MKKTLPFLLISFCISALPSFAQKKQNKILCSPPSVVPSGNVTICNGQSTTISVTAFGGGGSPYTYIWNPTGNLTNPNISNPVANPTTTTTYTCLVTDQDGCTNSNSVTITVNPTPTVSVSGNNTICNGQSTTLTASGAITYVWTPAGSLNNPNISNPVASPSASTNYTVTGTNGSGCTNTTTYSVTVNPTPTVSVSGNKTICNGQSTTLTASGAITYVWTPAGSLNNPNISNPVASPSASTNYTVTGTNGSGCTNTTTYSVTVNPTPTVSVSGNNTICNGQSTTLTASGAITYVWTPAGSLNNPNISNPVASPSASTNYTVTGTNGSGCTNTTTYSVTVNPTPTVSVSGNKTICNGQSTTLTASGAITYVWTPAGSLNNPNISNPVASPSASTNYTVTGTNGSGCTNTTTYSVTVNPTPTVSVSGNNTICNGQSTTLTASGAITYVWTPAGSLNNPNISNPVASPSASTNYTVTGTNGSGCTNTTTYSVTVNPTPTVSVSGNKTICNGQSTTLTASGAITYVWTPAGSLNNPNISNPVASPSASTNYTVTGTNGSGCTNTTTYSVTVNPTPTVSVSGNNTICNGQSTTLTASGAITYVWTPAGSLNNPNISNPVASPSASTNYTVTGTNGSGCTNTTTYSVTVNPTPTVSVSGNKTICNGQSTTLTASGAITYVWTPAGSLSNPNISNPVASPSASTNYTVTGTNGSGCTNTTTYSVTVNPLPFANAGPSISICSGTNTTLNGSGNGTYSWSPSATLSCTTCSNPTANPTVNTTYTLSVTNSCGTAYDSVKVSAHSLPSVNAGPDLTICIGGNTTIIATGSGTFNWSPSTGLSCTTCANPTANPTTTTHYTVTITAVCGIASDNVIVNVNPLPVIAISGNNTICNGQSTTLTASGGVIYNWSPSGSTTTSITVNPSTGTSCYTVTGTNSNGCVNTSSDCVTVNALPIVSISGNNTICNGQSTTLTASGGVTYSWSPGGSTTTSITVNPSTGTSCYTVTGTNSNGCVNTSSDCVTVNALPIVSISGNNTICNGQSTTLTASGGVTYSWSPGGSTTTSITVNPSTGTSCYTVTGTNSNGCVNTSSDCVTVNALPIVSISGNNTICNGQSTTLTASGGVTYSWSPGGSTTTSITVNPSTGTSCYTVTGTNSNGCVNTSSDCVTVNALPIVSISGNNTICNGQSTTLTASGGVTYSWSPGGSTTTSITVNPSTGTSCYTVTGTNSNGCVNTSSDCVTVNALPIVSISGNNTICNGQSTTLTASGGVTYSWSPGGSTTTSITVNPSTGTSCYTVTGTNSNGCVNTSSDCVTVNALPIVSISGNNTICNGQSTTLTASGGVIYNWSPGGSTTTSITVNPTTGTSCYTVTGTNSNGCVNTSSDCVTANALPIVSITGNDTICNGQSTTLTASGGITYSWSPGAFTTTSITVNPGTGTNYTVTGTNANNCTNTSTYNVTVNPTPTVSVSGTNTICNGQSTTLTASGGVTYSWSPGGSTTPVIVVNPTTGISYTVIGTNASGCADTSIYNVTVNPLPIVSITGNDTICNGQSTTLTASGGVTYSWSPGGSTTPVIVVNPATGANYTVTGTNANGCSDTSLYSVIVNSTPTVSISGTNTICSGQSATLTASGGVTYSWSPGGSITPVIVVNPATGTSYTVTGAYLNGCTANDVLTINVLSSVFPVVNSSTANLCQGSSEVLTAQGGTIFSWNTTETTSSIIVSPIVNTCYTVTVSNGFCSNDTFICVTIIPASTFSVNAGPDQTINIGQQTTLLNTSSAGPYNWSPPTGLSCVTCPNPIADPTVTTTYTLTTTVNGCTADSTVTIFVTDICGDVFVPSGFSPNGDGKNDYATVRSPCIKTIDFTIYNRWGEKVFNTTDAGIINDPTKGWNGYFNGKLMDPAVFFYVLNVGLITNETKTYRGNITLVQ